MIVNKEFINKKIHEGTYENCVFIDCSFADNVILNNCEHITTNPASASKLIQNLLIKGKENGKSKKEI